MVTHIRVTRSITKVFRKTILTINLTVCQHLAIIDWPIKCTLATSSQKIDAYINRQTANIIHYRSDVGPTYLYETHVEM